jgi:hypothetical protein
MVWMQVIVVGESSSTSEAAFTAEGIAGKDKMIFG